MFQKKVFQVVIENPLLLQIRRCFPSRKIFRSLKDSNIVHIDEKDEKCWTSNVYRSGKKEKKKVNFATVLRDACLK